jgi:hypothetical protein
MAAATGEKEDARREEEVTPERRKTRAGEWGAGASPSPKIYRDFRATER